MISPRNRQRLGVVALVLLASVAKAAEPSTTLPLPVESGTFTFVISSRGFDRESHVHIPSGYKTGTKPPLVLLLHGAGGNGANTLDRTGWATKADEEGFVVVAPDGLPARPGRTANFATNPALWNSGQLNPGSPRSAIDDVAFIGQLLDELKEKVPYDEQRVFVVGHSNGGGMTFRLASQLSERFAAIGTVAGLMAMKDPQPTKPLPTLYILGTKDPLMPIEGGEVKLPWGTRQNRPVAESLGVWANAIGCESEPKVVLENDDVQKVEYPSKTSGPTLTVLYLRGHGHQWPGGKSILPKRISGTETAKINATDTIWEFFKSAAPAR